ncbi:MAG TPA: MBL fold metallo-hydrolase [Acidimicrobiales bacterium]|nr:MBL fold metallo-hydrolase [Acidimicrobiales bacterium]
MTGSPILTFLGAAGTVTGSRFLVESGGARTLVDCGMFQGRKDIRSRNWEPFPVVPAGIDAVVLTHAHVDHCGYLPALVRDGFTGPVVCSPGTADLAPIMLRDAAHLQEEEAAYAQRKGYSKHRPPKPLFTADDAEAAIELLRPVAFDVRRPLPGGMHVRLHPNGHILGSATVELDLGNRVVLFTGDLGRSNHPILRPPQPPVDADVVVTESTYGGRRHTDLDEGLELLAGTIRSTAARGGSIVIPSFAVDRTEVVLLALGRLVEEGRIPRLPIYADSPMALRVLDVYRKAMANGGDEVRPGPWPDDPFDAAGDLREVPTPEGSRALHDLPFPSIILSASGMASGGRVLHHLARRLPDPRNALVLVGFQAPGTRGDVLASGAETVKLLGRYVPVRAEVLALRCFSVHADEDELFSWCADAPHPPDVAYVVHGEPDAASVVRQRLSHELAWPAVVPRHGERVRID